LIAAKHPRLLFEFVAFEEAMPAHWKPRQRDASFDWFVGQIAAATRGPGRAQTTGRDARRPLAEFAEFDCFACHHD